MSPTDLKNWHIKKKKKRKKKKKEEEKKSQTDFAQHYCKKFAFCVITNHFENYYFETSLRFGNYVKIMINRVHVIFFFFFFFFFFAITDLKNSSWCNIIHQI